MQVYENGIWTQINFDKLREGDRFRLFESTGEQVISFDGKKEWIAASSPHEKFSDWIVDVC